jgi:hypothetical protein
MNMAFGPKGDTQIVIKAPDFTVLMIPILGTSPYVSNAFGYEAQEQMKADQILGSEGSKKKKAQENKAKAPKDFEKGFHESMHQATSDELGKALAKKDYWYGIPATSFKAALVRACCVCGVEMTKAKMCVFTMPDGFENDGTPLVKITKGAPTRFDKYVRLANGKPDIRARGRWDTGWEANLRIRFDAGLMTQETIANLVVRAGISVGVGAGRPFSTSSVGQGWGTFAINGKYQDAAAQ